MKTFSISDLRSGIVAGAACTKSRRRAAGRQAGMTLAGLALSLSASRTGWTQAQAAPAAPNPPAAAQSVAAKTTPASGSSAAHQNTPAAKTVVPPPTPPSLSTPPISDAKTTPTPDLLAQTKPDLFTPADVNNLPAGSLKADDHTQNNAFAPVGSAWKMLAYLLPMLLVIVGCLHLLKRFQAKTGRLPGGPGTAPGPANRWNATPAVPPAKTGLMNLLLGGLAVNRARSQSGSIRLIETLPLSGASVHLLEVRGHTLLVGASPAGLNLLTELDDRRSAASDDFRDLLGQAAADMDAIDYEQPDLPAAATVSALEDLMRETNQAVSQRSRRFRVAQEEEDE